MDADSAWDRLVAESGDDVDIATMVAQSNIEDDQKALDKAKKQTPKLVGTTEEKLAAAKAFKESVVKAQNDLAKWQEIADVPKRRASLQTEQTDLQTDLQTEQAEQTESQGQQVADKLPASEEVTTETPTESETTPQVGLVEDARTRTLGDKTRKMLDAMAKRLGLQVEFVDEIVTGKDEKGHNLYANAVIVGKNVKIAWHNRNRAIDFLLGHEFTHRMQDLSPEAYAEFVEATKQALGEKEWNKRISLMRDIYKSQGKTISEQGIIDEVVADYAGELVEERGVFDNFVERNKNNRGLLSKIADVLRSIKEFFTLGKQRKINNAIARLEALIESASEANKNTQKSLIEEAKLQIKQKMSDLQKAETTIKGWVENKKRGKSFEIKLPTQAQRMVKRAMGKDYDSHNITANGIAHGFNNHGENGKKLGPNSIPVRKEDAVLIPYIMTAPDRVEKGSTDIRNRESVRFYKNLSNGYIVVVEKEQMNSSDDMETINFWIEMSPEATNAQQNVVPDINVRNAILSSDVAKIRKDSETAIEKDVENSVKAQYSLQGAFYSNAHHAVEDIKQDKATPQQWIAMLKKNGGLKAGEDKWLGLEDWLNTQQGSVTKQDIIDYINENSIKIEEVEYRTTSEALSSLQREFDVLTDEFAGNDEEAYQEMINRYGDDFEMAIWNDEVGRLHFNYGFENYADVFGDSKVINSTRLEYTTEGLEDKREIVLTVPTIDPYNQSDDIHFGDAGDGRAVAWIRFGETEDAEGNRVLVIDEIQSKRHQDGREKGYRDSNHHEQFENARKAYANAAEAHSDFLAEMKEKYGDPMAVRGTAEERKEARKAWKMQWSVEELGKYDELTDKMHDARKVYDAISDRRSGVPSAPFEKNWQELAMKRMLRYATDFGFDKLAWTTGEQQAKRYDIGNVVNSIEYKVDTDGSYLIDTYGSNGYQIDAIPTNFANENEVSEVFGKDLSNKIVNDLKEQKEKIDALKQKKQALREQMRGMDENSAEYDNPLAEYSKIIKEISDAQEPIRLEGDGLRVGGEGMKGFYDKMLPSFMNKYGKKWGVKVGEVTMPDLEEGYQTMHSIDVTDAMREDVRKGQPLFSLQGNSMTEEVESVLEDYTLNKDNVGDFEYALMQSIAGQSYSARPDYKVLDGVVVRVKGHTPDWDNFVNWETDKVESEKILNVTVGNYEDTDYRRNKEDYESFVEAHPETTAVNVDIEDGTSLADALSQIHEALKAKGIDFEFAPDYSWTKWSEYTPEARYSLASDMARDEQMQSLLKNTPLWNDVAKTMSDADDYTIAVEVLNKLDEDAVNSAKQAIDNANGVFAKADATDVANRLERALQMMRNAEVSEGEGPFGKIYRQFKGKAKEAFDYLMKVKEGDALGVYNRKGIGDIDLVWGDKNGGLAHIISKHIGKGKSFANIEDAQNSISDIINNGGVIFENGDKVVISKNGKIVTLRKNFRVKGKKIADKNWILTAYNENAADNTSAISGINQGQAAPTTAISTDKGNANSSDVQAKSGKGAQYSLQGNSMTEEEQRIVDEAKANGTFDASNPDIRYSLATDMARDAVMTALEGAGIDVEMATPEMVEDVLRARDAEFMSAKKRRALETVSSQDEYQQTVVSSADGAKVLKNLDSLAKEYQENVLSGNFNDVTLQKINQYIDETTPRNPYGRRLSQRLPQRVEREMYENQRENAVDALYSRISESSVPANGRFSESGRREIESRKKEALKGWAIATGNWHTDLSAFTNQTEPIGVGTDSKVYVSKDGQHVIKASKGKPYGKRFRPDIDNIPLFKNVCVVCADEG